MSTHCRRYPKCECPKDIGIYCGNTDEEMTKFLQEERTKELDELTKSFSETKKVEDVKGFDRLKHEVFNGNSRRARRAMKKKVRYK